MTSPVPSAQPRSPRPVLWRQLAIGLGLFGVYLLVDLLNALDTAGRRAAADRHGHDLLALQRALHLDIEHGLNRALAPHATWSTLANYEYASTYVISALLLLAWVWVRRPDLWRATRNSFVVLNLLAFVGFALYPTTPPRMLPVELGGAAFVDTVSRGGTVGSWGYGLVDAANQLAAMPSLHVGWALWVSVVLARITASRWVQLLSAVHVLLTCYVVMATANHYLLDAVAVVIPVVIAVKAVRWPPGTERRGDLIAPNDGFFLHVEDTGAAQHVGGVVLLPGSGDGPAIEEVRALVAGELAGLPRFRQRACSRRWRRPRWVLADRVDLDWHVAELTAGGPAGLRRVLAELAERPLPRDRPLWRVLMVRDVGDPGEPRSAALVLLVHHAIADGIGTVLHALSLFRPRIVLPTPDGAGPGPLRQAAAVALGLAQLATDGGAGGLGPGSPRRDFALVDVELAEVRAAAAADGARVTDLLLATLADGLYAAAPALAERLGGTLCCSVPLMVRTPESTAEGNATAAVMVDVPLDGRPLEALVAEVSRRTGRLRRPTRALASRFVMASGLRVLPEPCVGWFARTVYGSRFLHAVVSNMPGPDAALRFVQVPLGRVYPVLPLAPGTVLSLGALSWDGVLGIGVATDPALVDAEVLGERIRAGLGAHRLG